MRLPASAPAVHWHGGAPGFELPAPADPVQLGPGRPQPVEAPLCGGVARCEGGDSLALADAIWGFAQQDVTLAGAPRVGGKLWRYEQAPLGGDWLKRCEQTAASVEAAWAALGGEPLLPQSAAGEREKVIAPPELVEPMPARAANGSWALASQTQYLSPDPAPADLAATNVPEAGLAALCRPPAPVEVLPARAGHAAWVSNAEAERWRMSDAGGIGCDPGIAEWSAAMARLSALTQPHPLAVARIGHTDWQRSQPAVLMGSTTGIAHPAGGVFVPDFACAYVSTVEFEVLRQRHCGWPEADAGNYRSMEQARSWPILIAVPPLATVRRADLMQIGSATRCDGRVFSQGAQEDWASGCTVEVTLAAQGAPAQGAGRKPGAMGWQSTAMPVAVRRVVWNAPAATDWVAKAGTMAWIATRVDTFPVAPYGPPPRRIPFMDADEAAAGWANPATVAAWLGESRPVAQPVPAAGVAPRWRTARPETPIEAVPVRVPAEDWVLKDVRARLRLPALTMQWPPDRREDPAGR